MSIAVALLQGALGGAFVVILFFILLGGGLLLVVVFGGRVSPTEGADRRLGRSLFPARALCVVGVSFAVVGALFVEIATDVLGMILGALGYYLGSRVFGAVVIILSVITLFIGLFAGQGVIPGSYDEIVNGYMQPSSGK